MAAMAGSGAIVRQGHLRKLKTMRKKYFVLRAESGEVSARLEYYESEKKFRSGAAPRRVLPLTSCYNIMRRLDLKQKHVIALFTREEQLCIVAENEQDLHAWLAAILKQHHSDEASQELLHPIQHVWQVNVQKKGLGASKNIHGLYNLCLTDKTLTLVKIKSHNNVISDLGIPEKVEYSLKNIRRCGDSECFFYMEVGRQTVTGAGELWMHSDDSNIAQSMHSTIYLAMENCAKETENEKDHIVVPAKGSSRAHLPALRHAYSDGGHAAPYAGDAGTLRNRCDSMPSRACSLSESERPPPRHTELLEGDMHAYLLNMYRTPCLDSSRDDIDSVEWYGTPRIPEEPDSCDILSKEIMNMTTRGSSVAHSRTSSFGADEPDEACGGMGGAGGAGGAGAAPGYLPMAPLHDPLSALVSSSGSVYSGTPSTDPRFSEYNLEPAVSHISEERATRAYSVGSRPGPRAELPPPRTRAYSAGARNRPIPAPSSLLSHHAHHRADDHMELDFSANSSSPKVSVARTPPASFFAETRARTNVDEYVDMSPRAAGYVDMRPGEPPPAPAPAPAAGTPDGYVHMSYSRPATRPIAIATPRAPPPPSPDDSRRRRAPRTPAGSQTIFPISLDSPASPDLDAADLEEDPPHHALSTVREISEDGSRDVPRDGRRSPRGRNSPCSPLTSEVSSSPQYVTLRPGVNIAKADAEDELCCNPTANKTMVRPPEDADGREEGAAVPGALHYAALDLEPRRAAAAPAPRLYTQIDFLRSEQMHADAT